MCKISLWVTCSTFVFSCLAFLPLAWSSKVISKKPSKVTVGLEPKMKIPALGQSAVYGLSLSGDGQLLAAVYGDEIVLWGLPNAKIIHRFPGQAPFSRSMFLPGNGLLALCRSQGSSLELYKIGVWEQPYRVTDFNLGEDVGWENMAVSADNQRIALSNRNRFKPGTRPESWVSVYAVDTSKELSELARMAGYGIRGMSLTSDGRLLAVATWWDGEHSLRIWDVEARRSVRDFQYSLIDRWLSGPLAHETAFSPDGKLLASAHWDYVIRLWNAETGGREIKRFSFSNTMHRVAFSSDGKLIAGLGYGDFVLIDVKEQKIIHHWTGRFGSHPGLAFSADGKSIALTKIESYPERFLTTKGTYADRDVFKEYIYVYDVEELQQPRCQALRYQAFR